MLGIIFVLIAVFVVVEFFVMGRFGIDLSEESITLRGWTSRTTPRGQVHAVAPTKLMGTERMVVRYTDVKNPDGRARRTWAPVRGPVQPDAGFERKVETVRQWRQAGHGQQLPTPGQPG